MSIPEKLEDDIYKGLKGEWKRSPWATSLIILILMGAGAVYLFVYPNLAHGGDIAKVQADVTNVQSELAEIKVELLDREIIATRTLQCHSTNKEFFTLRMTELLKRYYVLMKAYYPSLPTCEDLR